jgi:PAS domain S-box-containing protein
MRRKPSSGDSASALRHGKSRPSKVGRCSTSFVYSSDVGSKAAKRKTDSFVDQHAIDAAEMGVDGQVANQVDKALMGGPPQRVGRFQYRYESDAWTWSDTVARMHGYEPGEVTPTTELVLSHKHPDDLAQVRALLRPASASFSSRHRIITKSGDTRNVVVVGEAVTDDDKQVVATRGFFVDITASVDAQIQETVSEELEVIVAHRETIDLAKGMLMLAYGLDADAAFSVLRWRSQELNVKLHLIAEALVSDLPGKLNLPDHLRAPLDHYLMTTAGTPAPATD